MLGVTVRGTATIPISHYTQTNGIIWHLPCPLCMCSVWREESVKGINSINPEIKWNMDTLCVYSTGGLELQTLVCEQTATIPDNETTTKCIQSMELLKGITAVSKCTNNIQFNFNSYSDELVCYSTVYKTIDPKAWY